ncbi:MAG: methyltransferase [Epsilonproteobacteria bacterium]|nr:methyltransferase [Campylobacterota bacterium]NPA56512.1 methyltransferase [Campylobacterota bacterium]
MIIYQPERGYCYNSDTIFLYDFITRFPIGGDLLDVGSGTGILALLVKRDFPRTEVYGVEIQEIFLRYAEINSRANRLPIELYQGDFLQREFSQQFDFIISNPPFYHSGVLRAQERMVDMARYSGYLPMGEFFKKVAKLLKPRGTFIFCYDAKQLPHILTALGECRLTTTDMRLVYPKADRGASLVLLSARKGSKSLCKIHEPLIVFDGDHYGVQARRIFERVGVHSIKCRLQ